MARQCGLEIGRRGIAINDCCQTSDPDVYAIGECAARRSHLRPWRRYKMAQVAADHLLGRENGFRGADMSAKLKLLGVDVGGIGDAHGRTEGARSYVYLDEQRVYKRIVVSADNKTLLGAVLVGDTSDYGNLLQLALNGIALPENPDGLILPARAASRPSAWIRCRKARRFAPASTSAKATSSGSQPRLPHRGGAESRNQGRHRLRRLHPAAHPC